MDRKKAKRVANDNMAHQKFKGRVLGKSTPFAIVEAYKATRTNLMFTRVGEGCQKIAVTSSLEGEGKTVNCTNLSIALAQNGLRVLLIDADLRRSMVHRIFNLTPQMGLSGVLAGMVSVNEVDKLLYKTQHESLYVLPAGHTPPNPAELLASDQMEQLLERLSHQFDYIMIDTPPISVVTDAAVLAQSVHGYVFVVREGKCPMDGIKSSVLRLEQVGANILGFLYNDMEIKNSYRKYSSYRYSKYGYSRYGRNKYAEVAATTGGSKG